MTNRCGDFKTSYGADQALFQTVFVKVSVGLFFVLLAAAPFFLSPSWLDRFCQIGIAVVGAIGLNLLTGFTGQISLGQGAFIGVGAYSTALMMLRLQIPFWIAAPLAGLVTAGIGMLFGVPSLRIKGLYLAIATLAAQFIISFVFNHWNLLATEMYGTYSYYLSIDAPTLFGIPFKTDRQKFYIIMAVAVLSGLFVRNLLRTRVGRSFVAVRDRDISAEVMGVNLFSAKVLSFGVSSFFAGLAGALYVFYYGTISPEHFGVHLSIMYLAMIIIGGLGSNLGPIYGAIFMIVVPQYLTDVTGDLSRIWPSIDRIVFAIKEGIFGIIIILFLVFEPDGLADRWRKIKAYWKLWPFSY